MMKLIDTIKTLKELLIKNCILDEENKEKLIEIIDNMINSIKYQDEKIREVRNQNIKLENNMNYLHEQIKKSLFYKNIVETLMHKIKNPISALILLYKLKSTLNKEE